MTVVLGRIVVLIMVAFVVGQLLLLVYALWRAEGVFGVVVPLVAVLAWAVVTFATSYVLR